MNQLFTLEEKFNTIKANIGEKSLFYFTDIQRLFPEKKKSSLYWDMSKLVAAGYMTRIRNGVYKFNEAKTETTILLSAIAKKAMHILNETGFNYYVSGIDILAKYLHHIPESYPVLIFVDRIALVEVIDVLSENSFFVTLDMKLHESIDISRLIDNMEPILIKTTDSFSFSNNNLATTEKAFLDLFYEITRGQYPLPLQELARMYQNLVRNGTIDQKKLVKTAYVRNMQYDMRYIVESKYVSDDALKFVSFVKEGNS
ncbi:MAG: hypothetical protein H7Y41_07225 [Hyphomonadaceae bacterium]|nr:hypothetical protein [Clostridia bacterium]